MSKKIKEPRILLFAKALGPIFTGDIVVVEEEDVWSGPVVRRATEDDVQKLNNHYGTIPTSKKIPRRKSK